MIDRFPAAIARVPGLLSDLAGPALVSFGEGAWIAVVYVLFEAAGHAGRPLGVLAFAAAVGLGIALGARTRTGSDLVAPLVAGLAVTALLGWLVADGAMARLLELDGRGLLALNPGGFLLGLAALRGVLRGRSLSDVGGTDLGLGVPAVAVAISWLLGGALADPARSTFTTEAIGPTVLFVVMAPAGNAMSRVAGLARTGGFAWTANRTWVALLVAGGLVTAGLALFGTTTALSALGGVGPWLVVAILAVVVAREPSPVGRPRQRGKTALGWLVLLGVLAVLLFLPTARRPSPTDPGTPPATATDTDASGRAGGNVLILAGLGIGAIVVIYVLRRRWVSTPGTRAETDDDRETVVDWGVLAAPWRWRPSRGPRHGPPHDAVGAYRAALAELNTDATTRRAPAETPGAHARRLRGDGTGGFALELLAADYGLARYADRPLSPREDRRALARYRRIRDEVAARAAAMRLEAFAASGRAAEQGDAGQEEAKDTATASRDGRV
jgi:hypothetical protein